MRSAFRVIRTVREKHACTQCDAIVQAPAPSRPIERGIAGPGLLARVLTSKYAEHTPLYCQSEIYGRQGVELSRSLLSGWVDACCRLLSPLEEALHGYVMTDGKLHADDTPVQVLLPGNKRRRPGGCGRMFVMTAMPGQRWHLQCGSLTARTEKGIHPQTHLGLLQRCAASGCVRRVQRAVSQWWDNGSCLLGSCPPKDPRCARPHPVSTDGRIPGADRSVVRHRGGYKGNAGRAAAC
ncbi:transposase [Escherichia coli]|nr:transposase [Escherichia coli]